MDIFIQFCNLGNILYQIFHDYQITSNFSTIFSKLGFLYEDLLSRHNFEFMQT